MVANRLRQLLNNDGFIRYLKNSSWMLSEYFLRIFSAIFVSIYIARYLGPEQFGILSFSLAVVYLLMGVSRLGMDSILVKELAESKTESNKYISTASILMLAAGVLSVILIFSFFSSLYGLNHETILILIISLGLIFQSTHVIDYDFQSQVKSKYPSIAKTVSLALSSIFKIYLVWNGSDLYTLAWAYLLEYALLALILVLMFFKKNSKRFIFQFEFDLARKLIKKAIPIVLTVFLGAILLKFNQFYIKYYFGNYSLGIYVAALRMYEGWIMIPQILMVSLLPMIVRTKKTGQLLYENQIILLFSIILYLNVFVAFVVTFFSENIILLLYGPEYSESIHVLNVLIWCSVLMGFGSVAFRYLIVEGLEKILPRIMGVTLIFNIILNLLFVPVLGLKGAAYAMLCSLIIGYFFYDWFDKDLKVLRDLKLRSIVWLKK